MDIYSLFREIADSWGLLAMFVIFVGVIIFTLRPGSNALHNDIAQIPLRNDVTLPGNDASEPVDKKGNRS